MGSNPREKLKEKKRDEFVEDVSRGMSDADLAKKYKLLERTATNWRLRLVGPRVKGAE